MSAVLKISRIDVCADGFQNLFCDEAEIILYPEEIKTQKELSDFIDFVFYNDYNLYQLAGEPEIDNFKNFFELVQDGKESKKEIFEILKNAKKQAKGCPVFVYFKKI